MAVYTVEQYNWEMEVYEELSYNFSYMCDYHFVPSLTIDYSHIDINTLLFPPKLEIDWNIIEDDLPF